MDKDLTNNAEVSAFEKHAHCSVMIDHAHRTAQSLADPGGIWTPAPPKDPKWPVWPPKMVDRCELFTSLDYFF